MDEPRGIDTLVETWTFANDAERLNTIVQPSALPGLQVWLKADSLALSDGAAVATWADQSGKGNNATQSTGANQPIYKASVLNGLPIVRFDGVNDSLNLPVTLLRNVGSATMVTLCKDTNPMGGSSVHDFVDFSFFQGGGAYKVLVRTTWNPNWIHVGAARVYPDTTSWVIFNYNPGSWANFNIISHQIDWANNSQMGYINGVIRGPATISTPGNSENLNAWGNAIGCGISGFWSPVDLAEFLLFVPALGTSDLTALHRYLGLKYAMAVLGVQPLLTYFYQDVGKLGYQQDTGQYWRLTSPTPTWDWVTQLETVSSGLPSPELVFADEDGDLVYAE